MNNLEELLLSILRSKSPPKLITTFNLDFLRISTIDNEFKDITQKAFLNLPDGYGIVKIIKKKFNNKIDRITGSDLLLTIIKIVALEGKKIAIIGGEKKVSEVVEKRLTENYNINPENLLCLSPEHKFENDREKNIKVIKEIKLFQPDIVMAALGCPRQEKWLFNNMNYFDSKINVGIGGTLDLFSGNKKRAPLLFQKIGLEWFWRLLNEPQRLFHRYIVYDLPFFFRLYFLHQKL